MLTDSWQMVNKLHDVTTMYWHKRLSHHRCDSRSDDLSDVQVCLSLSALLLDDIMQSDCLFKLSIK